VHFTLNTTTCDPARRRVLFHRDFREFTGGHLKIWDYFNHVGSFPEYDVQIAFSAESKWDATNPWFGSRQSVVAWEPAESDILFLAGTDWRLVPASGRAHRRGQVLNLIQHPRHADAGSELRGYLKNRAIRICVSEEVADAIKETGEVNGPVFVIPNGVDLPPGSRDKDSADRPTDLLICGLKAPELARQAYTHFAGENRVVRWLIEWIPRKDYLERLRHARITLFLPRPSEGFYLPALEGMGCGTIVVCPDCIGNRSFCHDVENCFRPSYDGNQILAAVSKALAQSEAERARMQEQASSTVRQHSLGRERASFREILERLPELWEK
jgi:glycosyltransferase involved in cell wall biosynthesis